MNTFKLAFLFVTCGALSAGAEQTLTPTTQFSIADKATKREILTQIVRHEFKATPQHIADTIRQALKDPDADVREGALAAVMSRAAGPRYAPDAPSASDWNGDRPAMQKLRPDVRSLLEDSSERVRLQAIGAIASLDFDAAATDLELSAPTRALLIRRYYLEPSPTVRAKIVSGFGTDPGLDSSTERKLRLDAFADPDHRVRHAASIGAQKLGDHGIQLLINQLNDQHRSVRLQATGVLRRVGPAAASRLSEIEKALESERDPEVRNRLESVVSVIKKRR